MTNERNIELTLGGLRPGSAYCILPHDPQLWWKPCFTRGDGGDTHCWYLSLTSDGSVYCHTCRIGKPRVYVGPVERVAAIKAAIAAGDLIGANDLAFGNVPLPPAGTDRPVFRDREDWLEFWTERAAIFEYLGGMTRDEAERAATRLAGTWTQLQGVRP